MNLELLKHAKEYIEKMANGINPLTGESVKDDDLINNVRISRCLFYVNDVLGNVLSNGGINNKKQKKSQNSQNQYTEHNSCKPQCHYNNTYIKTPNISHNC